MSDNRVNEIKKEDKKAFKGFIIIILISSIVGGILGFTSANLKEVLGESVPNMLIDIFYIITPFASLVLSLLVMLVSKIVYSKLHKEYDLWKEREEDDDTIDIIEEKLSYVILCTSINLILGFFFFGIGIMLLPFDKGGGDLSSLRFISFMIGFVLCNASSILIQKKIINFEKEINPLLQGSVYDLKFTEKWVNSCDEAIQLSIYKSAYKAYTSVSTTCIILWVFCIIGYALWDFGIMPMVMVIIIWLVQTISYCIESIKCSKTK